jgi:hypothetical protein
MTNEEIQNQAKEINEALGWGREKAAPTVIEKPAPPVRPDVVNVRPEVAQKMQAAYEAAAAKYKLDFEAYVESILARPQGSWTPDEQRTISGALRQFLKGEQ